MITSVCIVCVCGCPTYRIKEIGKYQERHGREITDAEAREEIVARACEDLFGRSEALQSFLADFAEKNKSAANKFVAAVKKILDNIKNFFGDLLHGVNSKTTEAKIINRCGLDNLKALQAQFDKAFLAAIEGNAARNTLGETEQGGEMYSLNENAAAELHKALYDTKYRSDVLLRDVSPAIMLAQKGVKNLPMAMRASHIRENVFTESEAKQLGLRVDAHTHYHGIGEDFFLQIIDGLDRIKEGYRGTKNATDAARRENYFLLVSEFKDKEGNVINVPVYIDEKADINRVFIDANKISTVFGREEFYAYVQRQIKAGNLVKIKNRSTLISERDTLIVPDYEKDASNSSIPQNLEKSTPAMQENAENISDSDGGEMFSDPADDEKSDREILAALLLENVKNDREYAALKKYQEQIRSLDKKSAEVARLNREIEELRYRKGKREADYYEKMDALVKERNKLDNEIRRVDRLILDLSKPLRDLVVREKKRTKELWRGKGEKALSEYRERKLCQLYSQKIEDKAKSLRRLLLENSEKYHVPDAFKTPVASFLSLLDFSSDRALAGGDPTKHDQELQEKFEEVRELLESIANESSDEFLQGLDLPPDAVEAFTELAKQVSQMAIDGQKGGAMVLRRMSSEQLKALNTTLYAMTRAVRQANELFATERYRHVSELSLDAISAWEEFAAKGKRSKVSDFLTWENLTPYYAFRRLGKAGEALFDGFRRGHSQFAFLSKEIMDFTAHLCSKDEVRAWERKVHTFQSEQGEFYMTAAQIMTLYELWKDKDAKQHLLGGGVRIEDISLGVKKKYTNDANGTTLNELLVDQILSKLTARQKTVADGLQKFMAEQCAEWGNEVSYKRWGIKLFGLDYYFPIESDRNTVASDVSQKAKENGLFTLLHKSFTKKRVFRANNRIMIRGVFDVFASHSTDMAKYKSFALPLLDMQKFINFKEHVTKEQIEGDARIELSLDNELSTRIEGIYGAKRYKVIAAYIREVLGNENVELSDGRLAVVDNSDALHIANAAAPKKAAKIAKIKEIVKTAKLYAQDTRPVHDKFDLFYYYKVDVSLGKDEFSIYLNVGRTKNDGRFHIYDITNKIRDTADRINGLERPVGDALKNGIPTNNIPQSTQNVNPAFPIEEKKDTSFTTKEVRASMEKAFGTAAYQYIEQFLIDMNGDMGGRSAAESVLQRGARDEAYTQRLDALKAEKDKLERSIAQGDSKLFALEATKSLQDLLEREKQRTAKLWIDAGRKRMNNYRERNLVRMYSDKIEEKASTMP